MPIKLSPMFKSQRGFTLIELLVVLAILGILAAALLAAINPVEQINKGQDASLEEQATEFVSAATAYYTSQNAAIWGVAPCGAAPAAPVQMSTLTNTCVQLLETSGDLKASFGNATNLANLWVSKSTDGNTVFVCFQPKSTAVKSNSNTKYGQNGTGAGAYWCAE